MGKALRPKDIHFITELPKTRNGKVMRRVIRTTYLSLESGDLSSLENRNVLESIRALRTKD
jgi:acetyl-CoA synthetase